MEITLRNLTPILLAASVATSAHATDDPVRVGILLGFTGPVESLTHDMAAAADLAVAEINASGQFLGGRQILAPRADTTCSDAAVATTAGERLVSAERVDAILGAACSGASTAVVSGVTVPHGLLTVSPASTSPALTTIEDEGLFFRTAPSDARQGEVLADLVIGKGIRTIAVTYTNNDYGRGLADAFEQAYLSLGGTIAISAAHEDGRGDYSAEVGALAASGASELLVIGYVDQGGSAIIRAALDTGAFERFVLGDGMLNETLLANFGSEIDGSFGTVPGSETDALAAFDGMARDGGLTGTGPYRAEAYDAMALIALAMQAAGSTDSQAVADRMLAVANAPGEPIAAGNLTRGLEILAAGGEIDYEGATGVSLSAEGDAAGSYRVIEIDDGTFHNDQGS